MRSISAAIVIAGAMATGACDSGSTGAPTKAVCDQTLELTWDTFGQDFLQTYCVRCHQSFNNLGTVQGRSAAIDSAAGAGPAAHNTYMPESGMRPSVEERQLLADWIACGAP